MRIAISGTHGCGKSTLIEEFLQAHPDFTHEPEPYIVLTEEYGEAFAAEPSPDDFYRQLEFNIDRLSRYSSAERVIFERSPVDFLAYLLALQDVRRGEGATGLVERSLGMVEEAIRFLDLIVFLPLQEDNRIEIVDAEDLELRSAVNERLVGIFRDDDVNLFLSRAPVVLEAVGSTAQRLRRLESALESHLAEGKIG